MILLVLILLVGKAWKKVVQKMMILNKKMFQIRELV